jgi:alkyl sulfatase BDS1-like metallo-beta-lactamase superfamily hydrolase
VVEFLTEDWVDALGRAAGGHRSTVAADLIIEYRVTDDDGSTFAYHVRFAGTALDVVKGPATDAAVSFVTDRPTATAIAQSRLSAQAAFLSGRVHIEGNAMALVHNAGALTDLDRVFAAIRADTEY